jgi:predicted alpha/beta hydrolase family esterase
VVPGLHDSGPGHWQSLWTERYPEFSRVAQRDFATPVLDAWSEGVRAAVDAAPAPPLLVAHSFGCLAVVHAAAQCGTRVAGAFLVAPTDPDRFGARELLPAHALPFPTTLVASTDDPWLKLVKAGALASQWGAALVVLRNAGHINVESGHGEWPAGYALLRDLAERAAATPPALN